MHANKQKSGSKFHGKSMKSSKLKSAKGFGKSAAKAAGPHLKSQPVHSKSVQHPKSSALHPALHPKSAGPHVKSQPGHPKSMAHPKSIGHPKSVGHSKTASHLKSVGHPKSLGAPVKSNMSHPKSAGPKSIGHPKSASHPKSAGPPTTKSNTSHPKSASHPPGPVHKTEVVKGMVEKDDDGWEYVYVWNYSDGSSQVIHPDEVHKEASGQVPMPAINPPVQGSQVVVAAPSSAIAMPAPLVVQQGTGGSQVATVTTTPTSLVSAPEQPGQGSQIAVALPASSVVATGVSPTPSIAAPTQQGSMPPSQAPPNQMPPNN